MKKRRKKKRRRIRKGARVGTVLRIISYTHTQLDIMYVSYKTRTELLWQPRSGYGGYGGVSYALIKSYVATIFFLLNV
jgi:hypothetical protein